MGAGGSAGEPVAVVREARERATEEEGGREAQGGGEGEETVRTRAIGSILLSPHARAQLLAFV